MRNRDGLKLLDHASFTDDVEGQISRGKLKLGAHEDAVRRAVPHIEAALGAAGFTFEHSGLGGVASGQLSVVRLDGLLYRIGINAAPKWKPEGSPPRLYMDCHWGGVDAARGEADGNIGLTGDTDPADIHAMITNAAAAFRAQPRRGTGRE